MIIQQNNFAISSKVGFVFKIFIGAYLIYNVVLQQNEMSMDRGMDKHVEHMYNEIVVAL